MFACSIKSQNAWQRRAPIKLIHELFKCKSHNCFQQWPCYLILLICTLANIFGLSSSKHPRALVPHLLAIIFHLASEASKWEIQLSFGALEMFFFLALRKHFAKICRRLEKRALIKQLLVKGESFKATFILLIIFRASDITYWSD